MSNIPEELFHKIMLYNTHPVAEMMKPNINKFNDIQDVRNKLSFCSESNFASNFFSLRDISKLKPLVDDDEYMYLCRKHIVDDNFYFSFWSNKNRNKNWYYKRLGNKIYF